MNEEGEPLLHETAYFTLNQIPAGEKLALNESTKIVEAKVEVEVKEVGGKKELISEAQVMALLKKHTCLACHAKDKKVVGPSYEDIAKRGYSNKQILDLVYKPNPQNWPDYATEMAPMSHIPAKDVLKIAGWINSLDKSKEKLLNRD
jgi:cytochrome c551/c552